MSEEEFSREYSAFPYGVMKQMITSSIPYMYRWKALQIKLFLKDLDDLCEMGVKEACLLSLVVKQEAEELFRKMREQIEAKKKKIEEVVA